MKRKTCLLLCGWCSVLGAIIHASAQGTAFTYQGRLTDGGVPANNLYDLRLFLYDAPAGGNQIGLTVLKDNVPVTNGLFNVDLDFGGGAFDGNARWLEISVRPGSSTGAYTMLSPRQPITPAPYAIAARNLTGTVPASQLSGTIPSGSLAGTYGNTVTFNNAANSFSGNGAALTSLNGANIIAGTITGSQLASGSVTSNQIANGSVTAADLAPTIGVWNRDETTLWYGSGNIGIRTASPDRPLAVQGFGSSGQWISLKNTGGTTLWHLNNAAGGLNVAQTGVADYRFFIGTNGNVGLGTGDPNAPVSLGNSVANTKLALYDGGATNQLGLGIQAAQFRLHLNEPASRFSFLDAPAGNELMTIQGSGKVGIGSANPASQLSLGNSVANTKLALYDNGTTNQLGFGIQAGQFRLHLNVPASRFSFLDAPAGKELLTIQGSGKVGIGTNAPQADLHVAGLTMTSVLTITGGADVAEPFNLSTADVPNGAVVIIDQEHPGQLKLSERAYDTRVAGIVSGANGVHPGISLSQQGVNDGGRNVALSGRVYVLADAATGPIKPGDLLTSSATPGHAMKVSDHANAHGAIIGKAMSQLAAGEGLVLVLVSLQ